MTRIPLLLRIAASLFAVSSTAAYAEAASSYRCIIEGYKQDLRFEGSDWYVRNDGKGSWKPLGCGTAADRDGEAKTIECSRNGKAYVAVTTTKYRDGSGSVRREAFDRKALTYESGSANSLPARGLCAILSADTDRPEDRWSLSRKLSAGFPFLFISDREALKLRPGSWEYPRGYWVVLEGKYHPYSGTWAMAGVGFDPGPTNSYHSCPPYALLPKDLPACGGIHQAGFTMDRWYKPEAHELVAFGRVYSFDEAGAVYSEGKLVGRLIVPNL